MSIRKSIIWSYTGQFLTVGISFVSSVVVARLLSPLEMGVFTLAIATTGVLSVFASFGVAAYVVRDSALAPSTVDSAFTVNALLSICLSLVVLLLGGLGGVVGESSAVGRVLQALAIVPILGIFEFRPATLLQREMAFRVIAQLTMFKALIGAIATVASALAGQSYMSPAVGAVCSAALGALLYNLVAPRHFSVRLSLQGWRPLMAFGVQMMSIGGLARLTSRASELILGRLLGLEALGLYSRASSIAALMFENIYGTATRVVFTKMADDFRQKGSLHDTFLRSLQILTAFVAPLLVGLAILAKPVIFLLYGEKWLPAAPVLSILMIAQLVALGFSMNWELFVLREETSKQVRFETVRAGVGLVSFAAGCLVSISAAALGRVVECVFGLILYQPHIARLSECKPAELRRVYRDMVLLAFASGAPALVLMLVRRCAPATPLAEIGIAVAAGIAMWLLMLKTLRHPLYEELKHVLRRLRRP